MSRLEKTLEELEKKAAPKGLLSRILLKISEARERARKRRLVAFGSLAAFSGLSFIPALWYGIQEFSRSNFVSYASLFITDTGVALANWREMLLSLLDSTPLFALTLIVAIAFVLLGSVKIFIASLASRKMQFNRTA